MIPYSDDDLNKSYLRMRDIMLLTWDGFHGELVPELLAHLCIAANLIAMGMGLELDPERSDRLMRVLLERLLPAVREELGKK